MTASISRGLKEEQTGIVAPREGGKGDEEKGLIVRQMMDQKELKVEE